MVTDLVPYSPIGNAANRKKIGIIEGRTSDQHFFYNDFVTRVLLGHETHLSPEYGDSI